MKLQRYIAEFIGTFTLTLAVILTSLADLPRMVPVMAALTLGIFVYTIGSISGAHLNPAVTIALATIKKIGWKDAIAYIVVQILGAYLASLLIERMRDGFGLSSGVYNRISEGAFEALGAFLLVFGVSAVVHGKVKDEASGVVIGGSLFLGIMTALSFSNGILNPAVAIGLGSISVMYLLGPIVGGVLAAWVYTYLAGK